MEANEMEDKTFEIIVTLPSIDDFLKKYHRFSTFVRGEGKALFELIIKPSVFLEASILSNYGYPSVLAVAKQSQDLIKLENLKIDNFTKQFIGSVICVLMEANGYKKTGIKKSVPHEFFVTGEYYERDLLISRLKSLELCGSDRLANIKNVDVSVKLS